MITNEELQKLLTPTTYTLYILQGLNIKGLEELVDDVLTDQWIVTIRSGMRFKVLIGNQQYTIIAYKVEKGDFSGKIDSWWFFCRWWINGELYSNDWGSIYRESITRADFLNSIKSNFVNLIKEQLGLIQKV